MIAGFLLVAHEKISRIRLLHDPGQGGGKILSTLCMWAGPAVWTKHVGVLLAPSHSLVSSSVCFQERLVLAEVTVRSQTFMVANLYL